MLDAVNVLEPVLDAEFAELVSAANLAAVNGSVAGALVNIFREVDFIYMFLRSGTQFTPRYTDFFETVHQYGWPGLVRALFLQIASEEPQSIADSNYDLTGWVDSLIHTAGHLARCRQLFAFCEMGFGAFTRTAELVFKFTITAPYANAEAYDLLDFNYVQKHIVNEDIRRRQVRDGFDPAVVYKRIQTSVPRPKGVTFEYHATRYVADYYAAEGRYHLMRLQLDDDFGPTDLFDGVPYRAYVTMLEYFAGLALMHAAYCQAAYVKYGDFERRNVLSLFCSKEAVVRDLARHLGRPPAEATRMLSHITLGPASHHDYLAVTSAPPAPFVQVADGLFLRSVAGCLNNPYFFLNYELKRTCRSDYDRVVNNREIRFRQLVCNLFPQDRFICIPNEVVFSTEAGKKPDTDIDAVIFDKQTKTLGLFQLKWQDPFAHSMKKRWSVVGNLRKNALNWLEKVLAWVERNDERTLLNALQVTRHSRAETAIEQVCVFVLGRRNMHFTGVEYDERAAWGSWPQLVADNERAAIIRTSSDPLKSLYDRLQLNTPRRRMERSGLPLPDKYDLKVGRYYIHCL